MDFSDWLVDQMNKKGWTQAELARRADIPRQVISNYVNRQREKPDSDVLLAIARALELPPEKVFRAAGLLPPLDENAEELEELLYLFNGLSPGERKEAIEFLRFKAERKAAHTKETLSRKAKQPAQVINK